jgi:hypothetical protein
MFHSLRSFLDAPFTGFSLAWRVQISLPVYAVIGKRADAAA